MRTHVFVVTIALLATAVHAVTSMPPADAQGAPEPAFFKRCGDPNLVLVFLNPDLQPHDDGLVHASGKFFIQFQARGEAALKIKKFTFSFGVPGGPMNCDLPVPPAPLPTAWLSEGAYIKDYRCDNNPADGFFVPIDTYNVPDGKYVAAVSAYDDAGNEMVRYWTNAIVENGRTSPTDPVDLLDHVIPWPMVLPGDGDRTDGGSGLYIEVAENVSQIEAFLNGAKLELQPTPPPERDDDLIPCTPAGEGQVKFKVWGMAWNWDGVISNEDVVKVRIVDMWGNIAEKVLHIGDPTIGGRVVGGTPDVEIVVDEPNQESDENGVAVWNVSYRTTTDAGIHADLFLRTRDGKALPDGLAARLSPNHIMMGGQQERAGKITITGTNATVGSYDLSLVADYLYGEKRLQKSKDITFRLTSTGGKLNDSTAPKTGLAPEPTHGTDLNATKAPPAPAPAPAKKSPGFEAVGALALLGLAGLARRRRRDE